MNLKEIRERFDNDMFFNNALLLEQFVADYEYLLTGMEEARNRFVAHELHVQINGHTKEESDDLLLWMKKWLSKYSEGKS